MKTLHKKVSTQPDDSDPDLVSASDWNDDHAVEFPVGALGAGITFAAGVLTFDLDVAEYFDYTLTANVTSLVLANPPGAGKGRSFMALIRQHASAAKTLVFPSAFRWEGVAPSISTAVGAVDLLSGTMIDGAKWDTSLSKGRA